MVLFSRLLVVPVVVVFVVGAASCTVPLGIGGEGEGEGEGEGDVGGEGEGEGDVNGATAFCDVQALFGSKCAVCHQGTVAFPDLRADAVASVVGLASEGYPGKTEVVAGDPAASFLFTKITTPGPNDGLLMPEGGTLGAGDVALVRAWIEAGATTECSGTVTPPNDPIVMSSPPNRFGTTPPAGDYSGAPCSTNQFWTGGQHESDNMRPGDDCLACHTQVGEGPRDDIMGTVFAAIDDGTNCRGLSPSNYQVLIDIQDASGITAFTLQANGGGNFLSGFRNAPSPYKAQVRLVDLAGNTVATQAMATAQTIGSCNSCHTETARGPIENDVPLGRITIAP